MAIYRSIYLSFWNDSKVADTFTPEDKYFYLYLLTNPHTSISGCYELSIRQAASELGYSKESVISLLERMQNVHHVIGFDKGNNEILIYNWPKYNWCASEKVIKGAQKTFASIKTPAFREYLEKYAQHLLNNDLDGDVEIPKSKDFRYPMDRVSDFSDTPVTVYYPDTVIDSGNKGNTGVQGEKRGKDKDSFDKAGFDAFWAAYPKKKAKAQAEKAWKKLNPSIELQIEMGKALEKAKKSRDWNNNDGQYIPYASTWLNNARWTDEDSPRSKQIDERFESLFGGFNNDQA
jgi:hypothetical protein